jgi:hypothetical protein
MDEESADAAWVHAYLHRQEATCRMPATGIARAASRRHGALETEWDAIAAALLG